MVNTTKNHKIFNFLKEGDIVEGTILYQEGSRKLFIDLGRFGIGVIYGYELIRSKSTLEDLKVGDKIYAKVINLDNEDGYVELSLTEIGEQKAWNKIAELKDKDEIINVTIKGFNKGGLITKVEGLDAFLPISQLSSIKNVDLNNIETQKLNELLNELVGKDLNVKILDFNPRTSKIILSEKLTEQESSTQKFQNYKIGSVIDVIISGIADFGIFVKLVDDPNVDAFIPVDELSYKMFENPKDLFKINDVLKCKIINIKDKIYLSLKALLTDPWIDVNKYYKIGDIVEGEVYFYTPFGAIINLDHSLQGVVRITDFGGLELMKENLKIKNKYSFKIESINVNEKRIVLKLNQ
ncbi:MAG: S1 RNA-binding domain-containing protein [Minisyncoccia bacterium]